MNKGEPRKATRQDPGALAWLRFLLKDFFQALVISLGPLFHGTSFGGLSLALCLGPSIWPPNLPGSSLHYALVLVVAPQSPLHIVRIGLH
jgi:hypothetical protein